MGGDIDSVWVEISGRFANRPYEVNAWTMQPDEALKGFARGSWL